MSSRAKRDIFYELAKTCGLRARSAFKLMEIDENYGIFKGVNRVVDLCAAPGSWSQVLIKTLSELCDEPPKVIAVDLQKVAEIPGVVHIVGDITSQEVLDAVLDNLDGNKADLVVCDAAPDLCGIHDLDIYMQSSLVISALKIVTDVLKRGGTFVTKIFRGNGVSYVCTDLRRFFKNVEICKPSSSRISSLESFAICTGFIDDLERINFNDHPFYCGAFKRELKIIYSSLIKRINSDTSYALSVISDCKKKMAQDGERVVVQTGLDKEENGGTTCKVLDPKQLEKDVIKSMITLWDKESSTTINWDEAFIEKKPEDRVPDSEPERRFVFKYDMDTVLKMYDL